MSSAKTESLSDDFDVAGIRLMLTSEGLTSGNLVRELEDLAAKRVDEIRVCYILTAALLERDNDWIVGAMSGAHGIGWKRFEIAHVPPEPSSLFTSMVEESDVIFVDGGNVYSLANALVGGGHVRFMNRMLSERVYVGASAGSMLFSTHLGEATARIFGEAEELSDVDQVVVPFPWYEWYFKPHFKSPGMSPSRDERWADDCAKACEFPVFFVGDDSALVVTGNSVRKVGSTIYVTD